MKINTVNNTLNFTSSLGGLSKTLYTLSNNDMLNASFVDVFAMDTNTREPLLQNFPPQFSQFLLLNLYQKK